MKGTELREIPLEQIIPHPANPNKMSKSAYAKLVANIKKTGLYEPIVVRPLGDKFQIINGHHRVEALKKLGAKTASAVVWELDDATTLTLLASLNRLAGTDVPEKKSGLYAELLANFSAKDLAKLLPATAVQIERLACAKLPDVPAPAVIMPEAMIFFLTAEQRATVEAALAKAKEESEKGKKGKKGEKSTAKRNAAALTYLAENYMQMER
jgi:ParB/RepB/Spo0J family partition protein